MKLLSFDIETRGRLPEYALQPCRVLQGAALITSYACVGEGYDTPHGVLFPTVENLRALLRECAAQEITLVGWNVAFDASWLVALGLREEVNACRWLDGMLLWKHLTSAPTYVAKVPSYGLKAAVAKFYPAEAGYESGVSFDADTPEELAKLLEYNKQDAVFTLRLTKKFLRELPQSQKRAAFLEAKSIPLVAESYVTGIKIDTAAAIALDTKLDAEAKVAYVKLKLDSPNDISPEVLASPAQLSELLYSKWELHVPKYTQTGAMSTDKEALQELALTDERASLVFTYREAKNNRTKFVTNTLQSVVYNGDGHTRPQARIFGTYTGRMTYSSKQGKGKSEVMTGVALHQWKRSKEFRALIVPPEGYTLLEFDFAGQEFRWMAVESNDPTMLKLCEPGEDAHAFMGARIHRCDYHKLSRDAHAGEPEAKRIRQLGKVANLSLQYRTSAGTLQRVSRVQHGVDMSFAESQAIHGTYQMTYKAVPLYWSTQIYKARKNGYVETVAGRRVLLDNSAVTDKSEQWSLDSTAINFPIQGAGADQKYLALAVLRNYLPKVEGRFYFELHDGLFVVVPHKYADRAVREVKHLLSNLPYQKAWGVALPIKFPVDAKMGSSWGALQEIKE